MLFLLFFFLMHKLYNLPENLYNIVKWIKLNKLKSKFNKNIDILLFSNQSGHGKPRMFTIEDVCVKLKLRPLIL